MAANQLPPQKVTLDVGGRKFVTLQTTLDRSYILGNIVKQIAPQSDGSFFLDADPDSFQHILDYLRYEIMPLFWTKQNNHDIAKYHALQKQAEHFAIEPLADWLRRQTYFKAIRVDEVHAMNTYLSAKTGVGQSSVVQRFDTHTELVMSSEPRRFGDPDNQAWELYFRTRSIIFNENLMKPLPQAHEVGVNIAQGRQA